MEDRYGQLCRAFSWKVPKYYNFGLDVVDRWAKDRTKLALLSIDKTGENAHYHTFYDLSVQSNQFANVLRKICVKKGDRVLVVTQSIPEWHIALIGMFKLGLFSNRYMQYAVVSSTVLLLAAVYVPFLQPVFQTVPLGREWLLVLPLLLVPSVAAEITKAIMRAVDRRRAAAAATAATA